MSTAPPLGSVVETGLYVEDLDRAAGFYEGVLGLSPMLADERFRAYPLERTVLLLLFKRGTALETIHLPGGTIPPHDGAGRLHFALSVRRRISHPGGCTLPITASPSRARRAGRKAAQPLCARSGRPSAGIGEPRRLVELLTPWVRSSPAPAEAATLSLAARPEQAHLGR